MTGIVKHGLLIHRIDDHFEIHISFRFRKAAYFIDGVKKDEIDTQTMTEDELSIWCYQKAEAYLTAKDQVLTIGCETL